MAKKSNKEKEIKKKVDEIANKLEEVQIAEEMETSYLDYSMSVIVSRALPDVRDGLKPVHRRILYAMNQIKLGHSGRFRKSATVVGEVLGKYHPHGDTAVYDSLVRMAQDFSMRYMLVNGHGNFGSIDGDAAAAMRYCITGDSLIATDSGLIPICTISDKEEEDINIEVQSRNIKTNKATKFFNSGEHPVISVETELGYQISGSYNHPLLCWVNKGGTPKLEWRLLENLTEGDHVVLNRESNLFSSNIPNLTEYYYSSSKTEKIGMPKEMNSDLAFLLGALVAEGSFHQDKIIFNNSDKDFYKKVKQIITSQFKGIKLYERDIKGNCLELEIYHQEVVNFLINIGLNNVKSHKKEIPFIVLSSPKAIITSFLNGLFEGDGSVLAKTDKRHQGKSIELTYNSKSKKLIKQLKIILLHLGILTTNPYRDKRSDCFKLIISGVESIKRYKEEIGFFSEKKKQRLAEVDNINSERMSKNDYIPYLNEYLRGKYDFVEVKKYNFDRYNRLEKNLSKIIDKIDDSDKRLLESVIKKHYVFNKIAQIKKEQPENVYSVKVDSKCHSFVANGFVNHNTECKMEKISSYILKDITMDTVDFVDNYDGSIQEPSVLPTRVPSLLLNGSLGIAVGMATNIPPHNLNELIDASIALLNDDDLGVEDLMEYVKGPDFPTGAQIYGIDGIKQAYSTGKGKVVVRAKANIEEGKKGKHQIVITEIPYQVNKAELIKKIADLVKEDRVKGISDLRDESDKDGLRVVIELKKNSFPKKVLNNLYKFTRLQDAFHINMLALIDGIQPRVLTLKEALKQFLEHRRVVVTRRSEYELKKIEARLHILEGLKIALDNIDKIIQTIKKSSNRKDASKKLVKNFDLSKKQAEAILDMRLSQLSALERQEIEDEYKAKKERKEELEALLASDKKMREKIQEELEEVKEEFGDERRTKIYKTEVGEIGKEELIAKKPAIITLTKDNYIKRMPINTYKSQARGGKGVVGMTTKEEDVVDRMLVTNTHSSLLFFTDQGKVYQSPVHEIPEASRRAKGNAIVNLLQIKPSEKVTGVLDIGDIEKSDAKYLLMATQGGRVKKTKIEDYQGIRQSGLIAIRLKDEDKLKWVKPTSGKDNVILVSAKGKSIRFSEEDVRPMARNTQGVKGIDLNKDDQLVGMDIIASKQQKADKQIKDKKKELEKEKGMDEEDARALAEETGEAKKGLSDDLLVVMSKGYGKRSKLKDYPLQNRGGKGVKSANVKDKTGDIVQMMIVPPRGKGDLAMVSAKGKVIRIPLTSAKKMGRNTQGVRLMKLNQGDKVASVTYMAKGK